MTGYRVIISQAAQDDLERLYDFLFAIHPETAARALQEIETSYSVLERYPHTCRKASQTEFSAALRELIVTFGSSGYVALFEITDTRTVTVMAVRHQRESDFH